MVLEFLKLVLSVLRYTMMPIIYFNSRKIKINQLFYFILMISLGIAKAYSFIVQFIYYKYPGQK